MKHIYIIKFLLSFILNVSFAQYIYGQEIHNNQLENKDSLEVRRLFGLMEEFEYSNTDTSIYYCKRAYNISKKINEKSLEAYSLYYLGGLYDIQGLYELAYNHYFEALSIFEKLQDKKGLGGCLNCIGIVLWEQSEQAVIALKINKLKKSIEYTDKALVLYREINYKKGEAVCLMNKGIVFDDCAKYEQDTLVQKEKYIKAIDFYKQAMDVFVEIGDIRSTADCNLNVASLYYDIYINETDTILTKVEFDMMENYLESSLELYNKDNDLYGLAMVLKSLATIKIQYAKSNKSHKSFLYTAIRDAKKSLELADSVNALFLKYDAYFALFDAYKSLNQFDKALQYHELYLTTKDSVHKIEGLEAMEEMETLYNVQKKENEIKVQKKEIIQTQAENKQQKYIILVVILILIFISILVVKMFKLNRQKKSINNILNEKNELLNKLNSTQNRLISIISHDFKAPLSAFYSITNSLKTKYDKIDRGEIDNLLSRMLNSSVALKLQLENMLNWAITQDREIRVNKSQYNLHILALKIIIILQEFAAEKSIIIENSIDEDIELHTDGKLLSIVLNNLISNAVKFSKPDSKIIVSAKNKDKKVILSVKDFGVGINKDDIKNLFVNQDKISKNENSGTGLGLIVSKDIVDKLEGEIWAESIVGEGTEIFIELS